MLQVSVNTKERRIVLRSKRKLNIRTVVRSGFLVAISIVMTRFVYILLPIAGANTLRISFGDLPIMLSGLLFGPVIGGLTGIAADLIGFLINSQGAAYHPGFTISSMMWGIIPGIVIINSKNDRNYSLGKIALAVGLSYIVISLGLNTLWLTQLYGTASFIALLPPRILNVAISIPVMTIVIKTLIRYLKPFASL